MNRVRDGFALPTVLIASLVMMMVLMTALTASSSSKTNLDEQFYLQLAEEAAETGAIYAQDCMQGNDFIAPWSGRTLDSGNNCAGSAMTYGAERYVVETPTHRTRWSVADIPASTNEQFITATGYVELLRSSNGSVWKTYSKELRVRVSSEVGAAQVTFGYAYGGAGPAGAHFATLTASGRVMAVGNNSHGQLGNGSLTNSSIPVEFQLPAGESASTVRSSFLASGRSIYVITTSGEVYAAGTNEYGQLGVGSSSSSVSTPQKMIFSPALAADEKVINVVNNSWNSYAITSSGNVYSAGSCQAGVAGRGPSCVEVNTMRRLTLMDGGITYKANGVIETDDRTVFLVTTDGKLFGWGNNRTNSLGTIVPAESPVPTPTRMHTFGDSMATRVKNIATDARTIYVITQSGLLYARGDNSDFQISSSTANPVYTTFVQVPQTTNCPSRTTNGVVDVRTDRSHALVLYSNGNVCSMGYNIVGELGRGQPGTSLSLDQVTGLPIGFKAKAIAVSSNYNNISGRANNSFVVGEDGSVYGAGSNNFYQLGRGGTSIANVSTFVKMQVFGSSVPAKDVKTGWGTTVVTTMNGRVYAVGNNETGQLGDGTTTNYSTPRATKYLNIGPPLYF